MCSSRGWRTHMVWSRMPEDSDLWRPFRDSGCEFILMRRPSTNFDRECVWENYKLLKRLHCDIVHCHNVHTSPLIACRLAGVPIRVWSKLSMSPFYEKGILPTGIHRLSPSIHVSGMLACRILALSRAVRDELVQQGVPMRKIRIVPVSVDTQLYANTSPDGIREKLGLTGRHTVVTSVGHAVPVKGWDTLIHSFARVVQTMPYARLLLVGSMTSGEEVSFGAFLKSLVAELDLGDKVFFLGQRRDIPQILRASDVFAFPSRSEGMASALAEALATGLPCVAAQVGGIPDVIIHGHNGLLFKREDAGALADQLIMLMRDEAMRQRLKQGTVPSARRFDIDHVTQQVLDIYDNLLQKLGVE